MFVFSSRCPNQKTSRSWVSIIQHAFLLDCARIKIHNGSVLMPLMLIVNIWNLSLLMHIIYAIIWNQQSILSSWISNLSCFARSPRCQSYLTQQPFAATENSLVLRRVFFDARHYDRWIETVCGRSQAATSGKRLGWLWSWGGQRGLSAVDAVGNMWSKEKGLETI